MNLGCSAELSDHYLAIEVEYGTLEMSHPERVNKINFLLKNSDEVVLREWSLDGALFENSDGIYRTGTILSREEAPDTLYVSANTSDGVVQANAKVFQKRNQITANHF